jgi:hypothetical protein
MGLSDEELPNEKRLNQFSSGCFALRIEKQKALPFITARTLAQKDDT